MAFRVGEAGNRTRRKPRRPPANQPISNTTYGYATQARIAGQPLGFTPTERQAALAGAFRPDVNALAQAQLQTTLRQQQRGELLTLASQTVSKQMKQLANLQQRGLLSKQEVEGFSQIGDYVRPAYAREAARRIGREGLSFNQVASQLAPSTVRNQVNRDLSRKGDAKHWRDYFRKEALTIRKEAKASGDRKALDFAKQLEDIAGDPVKYDPVRLRELAQLYTAAKNDAAQTEKDAAGKHKGKSVLSRVKNFVFATPFSKPGDHNESAVGLAISAMDTVFNRGSAILAAGQLNDQTDQNFFEKIRTGTQIATGGLFGWLGVPGTGLRLDNLLAPEGGQARKLLEATNTEAERQALVDTGDLLTFGQQATNTVTEAYAKKHPGSTDGQFGLPGLGLRSRPRVVATNGHDPWSGVADLLAMPLKDPTMGFTAGLGHAADISESVGRASEKAAARAFGRSLSAEEKAAAREFGRWMWLDHSPTARGLSNAIDAILEDATRSVDIKSLRKAFRGLSTLDAERVIAARLGTEGGEAAARAAAKEELLKAFVGGTWSPKVAARRQVLNLVRGKLDDVGVSGVGYSVGRRAVRETDRLSWLRRVANDGVIRSTRSTVSEAEAAAFTRQATDAALRTENKVSRAFWHDVVSTQVHGLDAVDRMWRVAQIADGADPALEAAVERTFRPFFIGRLKGVDLAHYLAAATTQEGFEEALQKVETLVAIYLGDAGPKAVAQLKADLARGFLVTDRGTTSVVTEAAQNLGLSVKKHAEATIESVRKGIGRLDPELQTRFEERLTAVEGLASRKAQKRGLATLGGRVRALIANPELRDEALRLARQEEDRAASAERFATDAAPGLGKKLVNAVPGKFARLSLDIIEAAPPSELVFQGTENPLVQVSDRVEGIDRYAAAHHLPDEVRLQLRQMAANVRTERDLFALADRAVRLAAEKAGVDPQLAEELLKSRGHLGPGSTPVRNVTPTGDLVTDLQTITQLVETAPLPAVDELKAAIRGAILDGTIDASWARKAAAALRIVVDAAGDFRILGVFGKDWTIKGGLKGAHSFWKFVIVTNGLMPIVGATAGFVGTDGDTKKKLQGAKQGALIGLAGTGVRYIGRIVMEESIRRYISEGMHPDAWIPGMAKHMQDTGTDPWRRFMSEDAIRAGTYGDSHFANEFLLHVDSQWGALERSKPRFVDAWWRIVNYQVHPETDYVARTLLEKQAGRITDKEAAAALKSFFSSADGKLWIDRFKHGIGGTSSRKEAVSRVEAFIGKHFTENMAELRLEGQVDRDVLKQTSKAGLGPDVVHAQQSWRLPRTPGQLWKKYKSAVGVSVLQQPTTILDRRPMANALFNREYDRLISNGVERETAQKVADEIAVERVNSVMFKITDESRFSQKVDFWLPFQQPREEMVRVWGKLVVENPARSMRLVDRAARMFNGQVRAGVFVKNDFTGQWQMTIPGSGRLAQSLFGFSGGVDFDINLKDMLFIGQGAYGVNVIPSPGGPYWSLFSRALYTAHPELFEGKKNLFTQVLWPYGPGGGLMRKEPSRLWMAFTGDTPPWEFGQQFEWRDELNKWSVEIDKELRYQHTINGGDPNWEPSPDDVKRELGNFFKAWAFFGSTAPAAPYPVLTNKAKYDAARNAFTNGGALPWDFETQDAFLKKYPEFQANLIKTTEYIGPDDAAHWKHEGANSTEERMLHYRKHVSLAEFRDNFKEYKRQSEFYKKLGQAYDEPNPVLRELAIGKVQSAYPEQSRKQATNYERDSELARIVNTYPKAQQEGAIDRWRRTYDVSYKAYEGIRSRLPMFERNPWKEARLMQDVVKDVESHTRGMNTAQVERYVATLLPAEQTKYWQNEMWSLTYDTKLDNADAVMRRFYYFKDKRAALFANHPEIRKVSKEPNPFETLISAKRAQVGEDMGKVYVEISHISEEMSVAAQSKQWSAYYALKAKRDSLYDVRDAIRDSLYKTVPDLTQYFDDLHAATLYEEAGNDAMASKMRHQAMLDKTGVDFIPSNEELRYLNMPYAVKKAYVSDVMQSLNMPAGDVDYPVRQYLKEHFGASKLFWEYLSPFQQDLLERNLPTAMVDAWKADTVEAANARRKGSGGFHKRGAGYGELQFAYQMFKEYNKRGNTPKPAAYDEYLKLPANPAVRADFLDKHPEVAEYIKLGPLANMPPLYRELIVNIMVKYGKWEGDVKSVEEVTDIAWARQQLATWSRRPENADAPSAYDVWVNMPTGPEKLQFLKAHPEVQNWIRLGPMANMPDDYQSIVRDIMVRYGEWTQAQDGLGKTLSDFYEVPGYARDAYLQKHPELEFYFSLLRSPQEQAMADLSETYFSMRDVTAKQAFLASHPELQDYFLQSRTKRYERFLNQVAQYMGQNPTMFKEYLDRQEDILAELLNRFAEPSFLREAPTLEMAKRQRKGTSAESGRQRAGA